MLEKRMEDDKNIITKARSPYFDNLSQDKTKKMLESVHLDLETYLVHLQRIFMMKDKQNLPVAFASNALYVLSRNNMLEGSGDLVNEQLLPLIHEKKQYLHAEGVALTVHALTAGQIWDEEIWSLLKEKIAEKNFNYEVVKSQRFDPTRYEKLEGNEHMY